MQQPTEAITVRLVDKVNELARMVCRAQLSGDYEAARIWLDEFGKFDAQMLGTFTYSDLGYMPSIGGGCDLTGLPPEVTP